MACASCRSFENARDHSLRVIRESLLAKLGFTQAPNTTGRQLPQVPAAVMERFERQKPPQGVQADSPAPTRTFVTHIEPDDFLARTDNVLIFGYTRRHSHFKGLKVINFRITNQVLQNEIDEAVLNFHVQELESRNSTVNPEEHFTLNIQVSRVTRNSQGSKASVPYSDNTVKLTRKEIREGKWLRVNITTMVAEFCRLPRDNLAVIVRVQDSKNRLSLVVPHPSSESNNALPYIEVSLRDNSHKRTRRTVGMDCTENSKEVRCCRYPLVVNFEEFGWDWIIAPKVYDANYCSGECPYSFLQKYPHTHLVHLAAPQGSGGPCCAPRKMNSITMLYFDHDYNIIYGTIPGMVVESCGCS